MIDGRTPGHPRLYPQPSVVRERRQAALVDRQEESDFRVPRQNALPTATDGVEAGLGLFQKDDNTLRFTLVKRQDQHWLLARGNPASPTYAGRGGSAGISRRDRSAHGCLRRALCVRLFLGRRTVPRLPPPMPTIYEPRLYRRVFRPVRHQQRPARERLCGFRLGNPSPAGAHGKEG